LGNSFGKSYAAQESARKGLRTISADRWVYYLNECLPIDERIVLKLTQENPAHEWMTVVSDFQLDRISANNSDVIRLIKTASEKKLFSLIKAADALYTKLGYK
jgi:sugar phosphate isomerase/epimerase